MTDFVVMVRAPRQMFITGPDVVKTVTGEEVSLEELGGADAHATQRRGASRRRRRGRLHRPGARLLSFLPSNNLEDAALAADRRPAERESPELDTLVPDEPNKPYDMNAVIERGRR